MHANVHKTGVPIANQLVRLLARITATGRMFRTDSSAQTICLRADQHLRLRGRMGWTVRVLAGTAWITQDRDIRDIVLEPGDAFVLDRASDAWISALTELRVCLTPDGKCRSSPSEPARAPSGAAAAPALAS
jgi:hypothetical protein